MSEAVILAIIGLIASALGIFATIVKIRPDNKKEDNSHTQYMLNNYKEENMRLRDEMKEIRSELRDMKDRYDLEEEDFKRRLKEKQDELDFANSLIEEYEKELNKLKAIIKVREI